MTERHEQGVAYLGSLCCALQGEAGVHDAAEQGEAGVGPLRDAAALALGLHSCPARALPSRGPARAPTLGLAPQLRMRLAHPVHCLQMTRPSVIAQETAESNTLQ